ncbi:MAG: PqqD family protein [Thermodesulfobacteriota bacterium]
MSERLTKKEGIQEQELDRELMLHDPETDQIHVLNETAKVIWGLADGRHTLGEIEQEVKERFSIDDDLDIRRDVERVIEELRGKGMIE